MTIPTSVCARESRYNFGRPHNVSAATWRRHLQEAPEDEKERIRLGRVLPEHMLYPPAEQNHPLAPDPATHQHPDPPVHGALSTNTARRTVALRELAKRARLADTDNSTVGRRKRARNSEFETDDNINQPDPPQPDPPQPDPPQPDPPQPDPPQPDPNAEPALREQHRLRENAHPLQYELEFERRERPDIDVDALARSAVLPKNKEIMEFVLALRQASLEDQCARMSDEALERLRNPPHGPIDIDSPAIRHSISMYLALEHASQDAYNRISRSLAQNFAGIDGIDNILSFHAVEKLIAAHTGVEPIIHDMCSQSCMAYTGPYAALKQCAVCGTSRWDQAKLAASSGRTKVAAQKFSTIPLAPQLQALYRHPDSARDMQYLHKRTQEVLMELRATGTIPVIEDVAMGWDYLAAVIDGDIKERDIALMVSLDGAQLYESKQSDCWIYMWVILNWNTVTATANTRQSSGNEEERIFVGTVRS